MTAINLNNLEGIPKEFLEELKQSDSLFKENRFLDNLLYNPSISDLMIRINEFCMTKQIIGFHYTRAIPEEITNEGLTCRTGEEIRRNFISKYGYLFSEDEKTKIIRVWNNHFDVEQQRSRDNHLFFNFTTCALADSGAEPLLANFGGEQVYMPIQDLKGIGEKIKNIGKPLILKCKLNPNNIETFYEYPWGRIAVSTYHCSLNSEALQNDQDGFQNVSVKPEDIELIEYEEREHYR